MSKLDELIKELCPDGVEYKKIKDVYTRLRGTPITASKMKEIENPNGDIRIFAGGKNAINAFANDIPHLNVVDKPAVLVQSRGIIDFIYYERPFTFKNEMWAYTNEDKVSVKFLYYVLKNNALHFRELASGMGSLPQISLRVTEEFRVPVPPLEVQSEIVKILDNFTELTAELTDKLNEELTARKKQYEYYRNRLLTFPLNIPMVKLKDIAIDMYRGSGIKRDQVTDEGVPCVRYGEIYTTYNIWFDKCVSHTNPKYVINPKYFDYGDILFAITGESVEDIAKSVAYLGNKRCLAGGDIVVMKHNQNPKYLAYVLSTDLSKFQKSKGRVKSKVVHTNIPALAEIQVPLPPLPIQERIVNVLDNFDKVCHDLHIGLPAEIEARKKQYEFYRDSLLTFLEKGESILTDRQTDRQTELKYALIKLLQYVFGYVTVEIGEVCQLITGATPDTKKNEYWEDGNIPWLSSGEVSKKRIKSTDSFITEIGYKNSSTTLVPPQTVVIALAGQGKTRGKVAITEIELCTNQSLCSMVCGDLILPEYLYFYLDGKYEQLRAISNGDGTRGGLSLRLLRPYKIPLPPLESQNHIVLVLRRFEQLINDISSGLPAEIEARKKQYEYYRDKLLSFKEKKG